MKESPYLNDPWCRFLPALHRALANPDGDHGLPARPLRDPLVDACAYWETAHYLLRVLLGWNDLATGLAWWYDIGKNDLGDSRLRLLKRIWDSEGQLEYLAAWAWLNKGWNPLNPMGCGPPQTRPNWLDESWWSNFEGRRHADGLNPYHGGYNSLHLGHSDDYGFITSIAPPQHYCSPGTQHAVLIVSHIESWRAELRAFGQTLPSLDQKSWHVELFDRQTGYLGLFRQSRITKCWFQGKHSIHMAGQDTAPT